MSAFQPAVSIDEVIDRLTEIVRNASLRKLREGYFAALYRDVTIAVRQKIEEGYFDDNPRMERLDVVFANRYLEAHHCFHHRQPISECWKFAFQTATTGRKIILQHLLLGMNAHINYDLAIATAHVAPGNQLPGIRNDFEKIMRILSSMIDSVQDRIDTVSPALGLLDTLGGRKDEAIAGFVIDKARTLAWLTAEFLAQHTTPPIDYFRRHDRLVAAVARKIAQPGIVLSLGMTYIRLREEKDASRVIRVLAVNPFQGG